MKVKHKMKVKVWTYTESQGDGSAYPCFFATEEQAMTYKRLSEGQSGEGWGEDCVAEYTLEFDENGVLVNPDVFISWDDEVKSWDDEDGDS
jgi:hypothetical protein